MSHYTIHHDTYAAVAQIRPGRCAGEVRNIHKGRIALCPHGHKSRSAAIRCAERIEAQFTD